MQYLGDHWWVHQPCRGHRSNTIKSSSAIRGQHGKYIFNHALPLSLKLSRVQFVVVPEFSPSEVAVYTTD